MRASSGFFQGPETDDEKGKGRMSAQDANENLQSINNDREPLLVKDESAQRYMTLSKDFSEVSLE